MRQESQPADLLGAGPQSAVLALTLGVTGGLRYGVNRGKA